MNVTIDWLRKKQVKGGGSEFDDTIQLKEIDPASKTMPKSEALPHEMMERGEIRARIEKAIAQLSPEHRAVILMKEIDDMQYHEIAEALGLLDRHGDVAPVLCAQEIAKFAERRL